MARLSKAQPFQIYEDINNADHKATDDHSDTDETTLIRSNGEDGERGLGTESAGGNEVDDDFCRRESAMTTTTVSSFPESALQLDNPQITEVFIPPIIRPSFRRPESVRRMQMTSPPLFARGRRSGQSRSASSRSFASPPSNAIEYLDEPIMEEGDEAESEDETKHYPLVLLHVTLLPVSVPWTMSMMQEVLPAHVLDHLHLLRSKITDTIVHRGILIPHPREEYELLEERLLEALELKTERITKCGHFRGRPSSDSTITSSSSQSGGGRDSDSGLGSSGSEPDMCRTCHDRIKYSASGVGEGKKKWSIRVFAANGLMRAPTWAAAWSEMESIDVEIWPWIGEQEKRELDRRRDAEDEEEERLRQDEEQRIRALVEEQVREAYEEKRRMEDVRAAETAALLSMDVVQSARPEDQPSSRNRLQDSYKPQKSRAGDLPPVYRASQIPLSVLMRNYVYLLMQDRRNVAIVFFVLLSILFAMHPFQSPVDGSVAPPMHSSAGYLTPAAPTQSMLSTTSLPDKDIQNLSLAESAASLAELEQIGDTANILTLPSPSTDSPDPDIETQGNSVTLEPPVAELALKFILNDTQMAPLED